MLLYKMAMNVGPFMELVNYSILIFLRDEEIILGLL